MNVIHPFFPLEGKKTEPCFVHESPEFTAQQLVFDLELVCTRGAMTLIFIWGKMRITRHLIRLTDLEIHLLSIV